MAVGNEALQNAALAGEHARLSAAASDKVLAALGDSLTSKPDEGEER